MGGDDGAAGRALSPAASVRGSSAAPVPAPSAELSESPAATIARAHLRMMVNLTIVALTLQLRAC
jgi:hypothetical protein